MTRTQPALPLQRDRALRILHWLTGSAAAGGVAAVAGLAYVSAVTIPASGLAKKTAQESRNMATAVCGAIWV